MNTSWKTFLQNSGARMEDDTVVCFDTIEGEVRAAIDNTVMADLSHFGLLKVEGADAQTFLHNQFTNDLRQVNGETSQLSAYCSPKGRMLALFRVIQREGIYYLSMPKAILAPTHKRLRMFVLMSKVTLEDASDELVHIGLSGSNAESLLKESLGSLPEAVDEVVTQQDITVVRTPGPLPRFEIFGPTDAIENLWQQWREQATPVGADAWELLDIRSGLPVVHEETVESFVPQMANLQAVNALSFTKGCYPGQEIVARMQYLGKLKRRMYLAHVDTATPPRPGDALADGEARKCGEVVSAQPSPDGGIELLAVVEIEAAEQQALHLHDIQGPGVEFRSLPYSLEK